MALIGVHLALVLTVLLAAACVLLVLLALVAHFGHLTRRQTPRPVYARLRVRRAIVGRHLSPDLTPLTSRDPPEIPPDRAWGPSLRS